MTDLSVISPIERARLSAQLLDVRQQLAGAGLGPIEKMRASALGLELRAKLGAKAPAPEPSKTILSVGQLAQKNGGILLLGDADGLDAYAHAYLDQAKYTKAPTGILLSKSQVRLARFFPVSQVTLPSGAVIYTYDGVEGVAVAYGGTLSGIARNLGALKSLMAQEWGPDKYRVVFGEDATPGDVQAYQDEQAAVVERKQATKDQEAAEREAESSAKAAKAESAADALKEMANATEQLEAQRLKDFERTISKGVSDNSVYQLYLNTLEELPTKPGNADFLGWGGLRAGEFERLGQGRAGANKEAYMAYLREWSAAHLSERVKNQSAPLTITAQTTDSTIEGASDEQIKGKLLAVAKDFYRGLGHGTKDVARRLEKGTYDRDQAIKALKDNRNYLQERERAAAESDAAIMARMARMYGDKSIAQVQAIYDGMGAAIGGLQNSREIDGNGGRRTGAAVANEGARQMGQERLELGIYLKERQASEPATPELPDVKPVEPLSKLEIVEYTTKKGKVLRGVIRTDLSKDEAKAIDPYTWRMSGGYFIREHHLSADTAHLQAAPVPVVLSPEQQAEKAANEVRQAEQRQQQALASQVEKLRSSATSAIDSGTASMGAERKTNTARRAGMAASAYANAANDESEGLTLNSIADAIEVGAAGALGALSSRAQLKELKSALSMARNEAEKGLEYREKESRRGAPFEPEMLQFVRMPSRMVWSRRYKATAEVIAKKSPAGNARLIAALNKMAGRVERWELSNDGDIAITRKANAVLKVVKDTWELRDIMEMLARHERLSRMGITNDAQLQDACRALLPHLAAKKEESAVTKAERAIIGQKVGIDFFPTPAAVAQRMAKLAKITKGTRVLEPSAGNGNLADAAAAAGGEVDVIEISSQLRDILTAKGYSVVDHDFEVFTPDAPYQAIIMNPPFSNRQDAAHIMRAYGMLASGGVLVAIAGEGVFFGKDKKAEQFRDWLQAHTATVEKLEGGTFKDNALLAQTGANARIIVVHK